MKVLVDHNAAPQLLVDVVAPQPRHRALGVSALDQGVSRGTVGIRSCIRPCIHAAKLGTACYAVKLACNIYISRQLPAEPYASAPASTERVRGRTTVYIQRSFGTRIYSGCNRPETLISCTEQYLERTHAYRRRDSSHDPSVEDFDGGGDS
jgi:hypothetical protein